MCFFVLNSEAVKYKLMQLIGVHLFGIWWILVRTWDYLSLKRIECTNLMKTQTSFVFLCVIRATQNTFNAAFLFGFSSNFKKTTTRSVPFSLRMPFMSLHKQWKTNLCITKDIFFMMCYVRNSHISWYEWQYRIFGLFFIARVLCKHAAVPKCLDRLLQIRLGKKILNVTNRKKYLCLYFVCVFVV